MKRIFSLFLVLLLAFSPIAFCTNQWREDGSEETIVGTESPSDIDALTHDNIVVPLDRMLANYRKGCKLTYLSTSTLTVGAGEVMLSNAAGTARLMQQNTSSTTVTWSDIDTGSEAASTTYYVYATQETTSTFTFSVKISTSSTAPSGSTYYLRLGSFTNDASSNITAIVNDDLNETNAVYDSGWFSISANTAYTKTHSLGTAKILPLIYFNSSASDTNCYLQSSNWFNQNSDNNNLFIGSLEVDSPTAVTWRSGNQFVGCTPSAGDPSLSSSGYLKIIILALE